MRQSVYQTFQGGFVGLERLKIDPIVAYGVDRMFAKYRLGISMLVRRTSDNDKLKIGFDKFGRLDRAKLLNFIGNSDGAVEQLHDKSGNGFHAIQTNNIYQPYIAIGGQIQLVNNRPTLYFEQGHWLDIPYAAFAGMTSVGLTGVFRQVSGNGGIARISASANNNHLSWNDGHGYVALLTDVRFQYLGYGSTLDLTIHSTVNPGTTPTVIYKNGRRLDPQFGFASFNNNLSSSRFPDTQYGSIAVSELILLRSAPTNLTRQALEIDRARYYNIALN